MITASRINLSVEVILLRGRVPSQYAKRRLFVRSRKVSKPRDLYLELSDRSEIWQALRQHCCRCACQISKRYDNLKYQSRGFETSRDLTKRCLFGYWDGAQVFLSELYFIIFEYILHISTPHIMIFCFPLPYFPLSQQVLYFLLSTLVLTLYIDVVLSLSIKRVWSEIEKY